MSNVVPLPQWTTGDRLRKARKNAGIGSQEMAARLGVGRNTVTNYESGRTTIDAESLATWCTATGQSADWILGLGGSPDQGVTGTGCYRDNVVKFPSRSAA